MTDIKTILELAANQDENQTLGTLIGNYYVEVEAFGDLLHDPEEKKKLEDVFEEIKKIIPEWEEKYGINMQTPIKDILKKIK